MNPYIDGGAQFRGKGALPLQAWAGTPLALNWTATIILSAQYMFNLINPRCQVVVLLDVTCCYVVVANKS
jgi:hypothetical protein